MSGLLTPVEVCDLLKVKPRTLEDWRLRRTGPNLPFVRIGRAVRYRSDDVQRLINDSVCDRAGGAQ